MPSENAKNLYVAGRNLYSKGMISSAREVFEKLVKHCPNYHEAKFSLAVLLMQQLRHEQSEKLLHEVIELAPEKVEYHFTLGSVQLHTKQLGAAIKTLRKVISLNTEHEDAYRLLGHCFYSTGDLAKATVSYEKHLSIVGPYPAGCRLIAEGYSKRGKGYKAIEYLELATYNESENAENHFLLAQALNNDEHSNEALNSAERALELDNTDPRFWDERGRAFHGLKKSKYATISFDKAIEISPGYASAYNHLACLKIDEGNYEVAFDHYQVALKKNPYYAEAWCNMGMCQYCIGQRDEARVSYQKSLDLGTLDTAHIYFHLALIDLKEGKLDDGWRKYESRLRHSKWFPKIWPRVQHPQWNGENIEGKTILIFQEQGFGDIIQFVRYLPLLKNLGAEIIFEVRKTIQPLLTASQLPGTWIESYLDSPVPHDTFSPLLSLPQAFKTTLETIPYASSYLKADPIKKEGYRKLLFDHDKFKVGLAWQGNPFQGNDNNRSIPIEACKPLSEVKGIELYALQLEITTEPPFPIIPLGKYFTDFGEAAAIYSNLDLVITVCSSPSHLAGGLGIPTWVLLSETGDWRWLHGRTDSPWYESIEIIRQKTLREWDEVIARTKEKLINLLAEA